MVAEGTEIELEALRFDEPIARQVVDDEMREIATFLEPERGADFFFFFGATLYQHVAEDNRTGPTSEILSVLELFVQKPS